MSCSIWLHTYMEDVCAQVHGQVYYLDADNFQDKELLSKLTPKDQSPAEKPQSQ